MHVVWGSLRKDKVSFFWSDKTHPDHAMLLPLQQKRGATDRIMIICMGFAKNEQTVPLFHGLMLVYTWGVPSETRILLKLTSHIFQIRRCLYAVDVITRK